MAGSRVFLNEFIAQVRYHYCRFKRTFTKHRFLGGSISENQLLTRDGALTGKMKCISMKFYNFYEDFVRIFFMSHLFYFIFYEILHFPTSLWIGLKEGIVMPIHVCLG